MTYRDPGDSKHEPTDSTDPKQTRLFEFGPATFNLDAKLSDRPLARRTDPDTSHAAADSMVEGAGWQRANVLTALGHLKKATADRIDEWLGDYLADGWPRTTAGRRLPELERAGLVERLTETRATRSGRRAHLWRAL